ncbi:MAG: EAL domain-containing protein [Ruminococcaceae bacterium]|nr:EAL domain-containing protein [Oscillospiraceae bacterium]
MANNSEKNEKQTETVPVVEDLNLNESGAADASDFDAISEISDSVDSEIKEASVSDVSSEHGKSRKKKWNTFDFSIKNLGLQSARSALFITIVFLVVYLVAVIAVSGDYYNESAEKNASIYFEEDLEHVSLLVEEHYANLGELVEKLNYAKSSEEVESLIGSYIGEDQFGDIRFYSDGKTYAANGLEISDEHSGQSVFKEIIKGNKPACSEVYRDDSMQLDCIGFFIPVRGSAYVDGILSIVPARNIVSVESVIDEKASVVAIVEADGTVLSSSTASDFRYSVGNNYYEFIDKMSSDKTNANKIAELVGSGEKKPYTVQCGADNYTLSIAPIDAFDGNLMLITMSLSEGLIAPELEYIRHIVNLLIVAIIAIIVGFVFALMYNRRAKEAIATAVLVDSKLDCPNIESFRREAKERVFNAARKYSIATLSIRSFNYLKENHGAEEVNEVLKFIAKILETFSTDEECYGYDGNGSFCTLIWNKDRHSVRDRIKLISAVVNRSEAVLAIRTKIRFDTGVYNVYEGRRRSVQEMINCSAVARDFARKEVHKLYSVFSEEIREDMSRDEKMEAQMEQALEQREFRLFLQPKYNVKNDRTDSAEALVRWFDTKSGEYIFPGDFITLFETNGFITKLDHFIYIEVLEYISRAVEKGETVVPIAVNVSRVTAVSEDFLEFYVGNKKKYRIADDFITIEFTENFAMEDYEKIDNIVQVLHRNGLRCSIDDFGSGYSSFSILKQIAFDELKLDSMFTRRGTDFRRDDKLLSTMIELAKSMGMTVVQEGVETKENFERVINYGCDVIQGYYYAKAMPLEEFRVFIRTNTSIKYKSLVK